MSDQNQFEISIEFAIGLHIHEQNAHRIVWCRNVAPL